MWRETSPADVPLLQLVPTSVGSRNAARRTIVRRSEMLGERVTEANLLGLRAAFGSPIDNSMANASQPHPVIRQIGQLHERERRTPGRSGATALRE